MVKKAPEAVVTRFPVLFSRNMKLREKANSSIPFYYTILKGKYTRIKKEICRIKGTVMQSFISNDDKDR